MSADVDAAPGLLRRAAPILRDSVAAVVAGLLLFASFPPRPLWFLAPVGIGLLVLVLTGWGSGPRRMRAGFGYGYLAGLGFLLPLLPWIGVYVGPVPWLALSAVEALFVGLFGALAVTVARLPLAPLWIACTWSMTEWLRSSVPFGGFPWGRLAFGQSEGLLLSLASIGGAPLVSFAVALTGTGLAALVAGLTGTPRRWAPAAALTLIAPVLAAALSPTLPGMDAADSDLTDTGTITVAAIQGGVPRLGLDFNAQRRAVLDNHVAETLDLATDVDAGDVPRPDIVIWPENASDIDPLRNRDAAAAITAAARAVGAPILVGTVLVNGDGTTTNSVIVWDPATGPGDRHDKKIIQPFGEYLPYRDFFRHFSEYADRAGNFVPGDGDGVVQVTTGRGSGEPTTIPVGVATCYEVAFDRALTEAVRGGAQLIAVPTNNATFGDTEMTYQQLAMSRLRAVEHGRTVVVAATSGVSAIVGPDGTVQESSSLFTPTTLVAQVPLRDSTTLATRFGPIPEFALCVGAALALLAAALHSAAQRRARQAAPSTDGVDVHGKNQPRLGERIE
ncbi:apolipoprotein N-acyltransferase [Rhodococcus sp. NPDC058505]|uniref:apolipoprotein N-acyltransferase n=1 Tax=unclassified Rhodococcus (in: high G+C Gram-positive bacteria) TaxID=192944 RepID=UPI003666C832